MMVDGVVFSNVNLTLKDVKFSSGDSLLVSTIVAVVTFEKVKVTFAQMIYLVQFSNQTGMWRIKKMGFW